MPSAPLHLHLPPTAPPRLPKKQPRPTTAALRAAAAHSDHINGLATTSRVPAFVDLFSDDDEDEDDETKTYPPTTTRAITTTDLSDPPRREDDTATKRHTHTRSSRNRKTAAQKLLDGLDELDINVKDWNEQGAFFISEERESRDDDGDGGKVEAEVKVKVLDLTGIQENTSSPLVRWGERDNAADEGSSGKWGGDGDGLSVFLDGELGRGGVWYTTSSTLGLQQEEEEEFRPTEAPFRAEYEHREMGFEDEELEERVARRMRDERDPVHIGCDVALPSVEVEVERGCCGDV
jgi:hypothetical protein